MFRSGTATRGMITIAFIAIAIGNGCAQLRLPQIDPTGTRIFLPSPYSTSVATPVASPSFPRAPRAAFSEPAAPPPCPFPNVAPPAITTAQLCKGCAKPGCPTDKKCGGVSIHKIKDHLHPAKKGRVVLLPKRVIAPVGGEVVLVSGLFGSHGKLVKRKELQWILSQGSVGHFIEAGGHGHNFLAGFKRNKTQLITADLARSRTTAKPKLLTRGTESVVDDVALLAGQGWITLTSPSEGVSYVTVMAPDSKIWDQRRETATIYWIDARWELPPPATLRAGQPHTLQTRVFRNSAGSPADNWVVRYELAEGSSAAFLPSGGQMAETIVDRSGLASVQIQSNDGNSKPARVRVQIIRPAELGDGLPRITVGQGWTTVAWTAPGLVLQAAGPASARPGETLTYQIQVSNPGNVVTRGVVVKDEAPAGLVILGSNPPFEQFGQLHQWPLGDLAPGQTQQITVQCRMEFDRTVRYGFRAESVDGLNARDDVETSVQLPAIALDIRGPEQAQVGERVTYEVHVRNTSGRDLSDVVISDIYDLGLEQTEGVPSPIRRRLGPIPANQVKSFAISFFVRQAGTLCHTLEATAPDGFTARSRACLQAIAAQPVGNPAVSATITGPAQQAVGQYAMYETRVTNTGDVPLTRVRIAMSYDPVLSPRQASGGYRAEQGQFVWGVDQLNPGQTEVRQLNCLCLAAAVAATCRVDVASAENVTTSSVSQTRISAAPSANAPQPNPPVVTPVRPPGAQAIPGGAAIPGGGPANPGGGAANPSGGAAAPATGLVKLTITDSLDPVAVGGQTTYLVVVSNETDQIDRNVRVVLRLPAGMDLIRVLGPVGVRSSGDGGRTIELAPVNTLRAREKLPPIRVDVRTNQAGELTFQVEVSSQLMPQAVQRAETTTSVQ